MTVDDVNALKLKSNRELKELIKQFTEFLEDKPLDRFLSFRNYLEYVKCEFGRRIGGR